MSIKVFNKDNFNAEVINSDKLVLIDFWAEWCTYCKMQTQPFEAAAEENPDVVFGSMNVDENGEIAAQYGIMSIPALILFKDGEPVQRLTGLQSEDEIQELLDENK